MISNKYLNGSGVRLQQALFIEFDYAYDTRLALYTLSREDKVVEGVTYPSLYRLYMECEDVTEAEFVSKYLYDTKQWELLCSSPFLREEVLHWRRDLRLQRMGLAVATLEEDMISGGRSAMSSAKFLIEKVYGLSSLGKGRPSNQKHVDDTKLFDSQVADDVRRVLTGVKA